MFANQSEVNALPTGRYTTIDVVVMVTLTPDDLGASHHHADGQEYGEDEHNAAQILDEVSVADLNCARRPDPEHHGNPANRTRKKIVRSVGIYLSFFCFWKQRKLNRTNKVKLNKVM